MLDPGISGLRICTLLVLILLMLFPGKAAEPLQGRLFRAVDGQSSIKIISAEELELTNEADGPHWVCKYSRDGESLRIVATLLGSPQALYFKIVAEGLQRPDGTLLYDEAHFAPALSAAKVAEEERKRKASAGIPTATATPTLPPLPKQPIAIAAPRPEYPYEARSRHITGSGVVVLTINPSTGLVTDAVMTQSTGSPILDNSALAAFRRWQFKPGHYSPKLKMPINFTMTGAQY